MQCWMGSRLVTTSCTASHAFSMPSTKEAVEEKTVVKVRWLSLEVQLMICSKLEVRSICWLNFSELRFYSIYLHAKKIGNVLLGWGLVRLFESTNWILQRPKCQQICWGTADGWCLGTWTMLEERRHWEAGDLVLLAILACILLGEVLVLVVCTNWQNTSERRQVRLQSLQRPMPLKIPQHPTLAGC